MACSTPAASSSSGPHPDDDDLSSTRSTESHGEDGGVLGRCREQRRTSCTGGARYLLVAGAQQWARAPLKPGGS